MSNRGMRDNHSSILEEALLVLRYLPTDVAPKRHGSYQTYQDDRIQIMRDTWIDRVVISLPLHSDAWVTVYECSPPGIYRPGMWVQYLAGLAERARKARHQHEVDMEAERRLALAARFAPIDDAALFAGVEV